MRRMMPCSQLELLAREPCKWFGRWSVGGSGMHMGMKVSVECMSMDASVD